MRLSGHVSEMVPGRKYRSVGGQDYTSSVATANVEQYPREFYQQGTRERIALIRPVERDSDDVGLTFNE
jgi:hypothetical protein